MFLPESLDLHIHAGGEIELHQGIDRLLRRLEDVEQALVRPDLESFARLLVHMRRPQHAVLVLHGGQWNRARDLRARAPRRFDDLPRGLIQDAIIVSFQPDANSLFSNHASLANPSRLAREERTCSKLHAASFGLWLLATGGQQPFGYRWSDGRPRPPDGRDAPPSTP